MLFIKNIVNLDVSKFFLLTFQGFNNGFYYVKPNGDRGSIEIDKVIYETWNGERYKSDTEAAWLCDEYILKLKGGKPYDFLHLLYSDAELKFDNNKIIFNYKYNYCSMDSYETIIINESSIFELDKEYHEFVMRDRQDYNKFKGI